MAVIYNATLRTARMNAVETALDGGAGAAKIKIYTSGLGKLLVTLTCADPAGAVAGDTLTFDCTPALTAVAGNTGTAAEATITDSDDVVIVSGLTVGTGTENIVLDSASITSGQTVNITSGSLSHNTTG